MEAIINTCPQANIHFQNALNRFHAGRGTGMATMELKIYQELARVDQDPLFIVLLELRRHAIL